jgi:hypothetical protein
MIPVLPIRSSFLATLALAAALTACSGADAIADEAAPTGDQLAGTWASDCVDPGNGQGFTLAFDLTESTWAVDYTAFADAACTTRNLTVRIEGPYTLGVASAVAPGTREGDFGFTSKTVTPHNEGAAGFLPQACGSGTFTVGVPTDITAGCPGLGAYPVSDCPTDHDIVSVVDDLLRFGARPADNNMCSPDLRPTALGVVLRRTP